MDGLRFFRTFLAVARHGSFSEAAARVGLTQSAVSFQMRALENELGRKLFDRSGRLARLNAEGRELVPEVEQLLDTYDRIRQPRQRPGELAGSVAIGALVSCMHTLLRVTSQLKRDHPALDIRVQHGQAHVLAARVLAGDIDAAFVVQGQSLAPALRWTPMYSETMVVLTYAGAPGESAAEVLAANPYLRFDPAQRTGALAEKVLRELGLSIEPFLELNAISELTSLIEQGVGATLVPQLRDGGWADNPRLRVLPLPAHIEAPVRHVGMIERLDHARQPITTALRERCAQAWA
ncbi:MAG: HTH-type transcriptional regulator YofA [Paracidovorax wautersii]|uniref:HTH-type transcriptional regulator YofA n=1 Tax=Paracidovorax wautersii TaxID=1177982 RepID=A0A7V8JQ18_9BURK|nr:MAG: HTH-type transcriptional regulator YofA [Paracidovorax wautersii]